MNGSARAIAVSSLAMMLIVGSARMAWAEEESLVDSQPMIGVAAPGFNLSMVGGDSLSLADLEGKFVVIHFGASW
jgi:cytochrome oxidase Cu insertion factor (SCO1/SenC/PrrC family)